jgi:hypothetical protein
VKPLSAGSEIDAYCTKCRMDLGHRIIAMVGPTPKRVICQTCNSQHNYRAPRTDARAKVVGRNAAPRNSGTATPRSSAPRGRGEQERRAEWEARIAGKGVNAFNRYSMERSFSVGDLILHSRFGEGYVTEVVEGAKINVMFRDGPRTLAQKPSNGAG